MKVKGIAFTLIAAFVAIGYAKMMANSLPAQAKPLAEFDEPTSVLTSIAENPESQEQESCYYDLSLNDLGSLNLSFKLKPSPDPADSSDIQNYIKNIIPIVKNIDMVEIL